MSVAEEIVVPLPGLFPGLLGNQFAGLAPEVRALHGGRSARWTGTATVRRGRSLLAALINRCAGMPVAVADAPTHVAIDVREGCEIWTRHFGDQRALRSTLRARNGLLVEQMGPIRFTFRLTVRSAGIDWILLRVAFVGIRLPARLFRVAARSEAQGGAYRFEVDTAVAGVGELVAYQGALRGADE